MCHILDYNEILLQAIDTVLVSKLESLQYDKTVKCQVITDLGDGHYTVSENDTTKFEAVATQDATYTVGDYVQVLVPSGDYTNQKIIVSKYIASEDTKATVYLRPIDKFISLKPQRDTLETVSYIIAGSQETAKKIGEIDIVSNNSICDSLIVGCDVKADLTSSGGYGLLFYLYYNDGDSKVVAAQLDSSQLFGDPYKYKTFFSHISAFDISAIHGNITKIEVYLYQKDFEDKGEVIEVRNLWAQLGEDITNIPNETLKLIAEDDENSYDASGTKELLLTWYNKNEDGRYIGYTQGGAYAGDCASELDYIDQLENKYLVNYKVDAATVAPMRETVALAHNQDEIASIYSKLERNLRNLNIYVLQRGGAMDGEFSPWLELCDPTAEENTFLIALAGQAEENKASYTVFNAQALADYQAVAVSENGLEYKKVSDIAVQGKSLNNLWAGTKNAILAAQKTTSQTAYFDLLMNNYEKYYKEYQELVARFEELRLDSSSCVTQFYDRLAAGDTQTLEEARSAFIAVQSNKYDLYWYRASAGSTDQWLGQGWKLIGRDPTFASDEDLPERVTYLLETDPKAEEMEIKALLFYQHEQYASNSLKLANLAPPAQTPPDIASALRIEHGENSQDSYQKYGSNYVVLATSDYITKRTLTLSCEGLENPDSVIGRVVYWYVPDNGTMLRAEESELKAQGFTYLDLDDTTETDDENLAAILSHKREGYYCYYKVIATKAEDLQFYYHIAQVYNPSYNNNTIVCVLDQEGVDYSARKTFTFSTYGTMGTQYTLALVPKERQQAVIVGSDSPLVFNASLTGYGGTEQDNLPDITYSLDKVSGLVGADSDSDYQVIFEKDVEDLESYKSTACFLTATATLSCSESDDKEVELVSKIPVPFATGNYYLQGATTIVYNDYGTLLTTSNIEPYALYDLDSGKPVSGVSYEITPTGLGQPTLRTVNGQTVLKPCQMYIDGLEIPIITVKKNRKVIFVQPIYIYQDRWSSSLLNSWDEKLTIDETNGIILSTMMGAGYKNRYNQFYGVLMGKLSDTVGLYGFSGGVVAYSLDINGKAVFGKSGSGQIIIDGENATITSSNYLFGNSGMKINLKDGHIDAYNFKLTSSRFLLDSSGESDYFRVKDNADNNLILIGESEYYLQSSNETMKIDLANGEITAKNFTLDAMTDELGLYLSSNGIFKVIQNDSNKIIFEDGKLTISTGSLVVSNGSNFLINSETGQLVVGGLSYLDGGLVINGGSIFGAYLDVDEGRIGGWIVNETSLSDEGGYVFLDCGNNELDSLITSGTKSPIRFGAGGEEILSESHEETRNETFTCFVTIQKNSTTTITPRKGKIKIWTIMSGTTVPAISNLTPSQLRDGIEGTITSNGELKLNIKNSVDWSAVDLTISYTYQYITTVTTYTPTGNYVTQILQDGSFYTTAAKIGNWILVQEDSEAKWKGSLYFQDSDDSFVTTQLGRYSIKTKYLDAAEVDTGTITHNTSLVFDLNNYLVEKSLDFVGQDNDYSAKFSKHFYVYGDNASTCDVTNQSIRLGATSASSNENFSKITMEWNEFNSEHEDSGLIIHSGPNDRGTYRRVKISAAGIRLWVKNGNSNGYFYTWEQIFGVDPINLE